MTSLISIWRCSPISFLFVYLPLSSGMVDHDVIPVNTELEERFWRRSSLEPIRAMRPNPRGSPESFGLGPVINSNEVKVAPTTTQETSALPTPDTPMAMALSVVFSLWSPDENITRLAYILATFFNSSLDTYKAPVLATLENFFCSAINTTGVSSTIPARIDEEQFCGIDLDTVNRDRYDEETEFGNFSNAFALTIQNNANVEVSVQNSDDFVWSVWNVSYPIMLSSVESTSASAASIATANVEDLQQTVQLALDAHIQETLFAEHLDQQIRAFAHYFDYNTTMMKVYPSVLGEEPKTFMEAAAAAELTGAEKFNANAAANDVARLLRGVRFFGVGLFILTVLSYIFILHLARVRMQQQKEKDSVSLGTDEVEDSADKQQQQQVASSPTGVDEFIY